MRAAFAVTLGAALGFALPAGAAPLPLELSWQAPSECPSGERIRSELVRITRPRPGRQLAALTASGVITHRGRGYQLSLQTERGGVTREALLDSPTCEPLLRAATLMLALAYGDGADIREDVPNVEPAAPASQPRSHSFAGERATGEPFARTDSSAQRRLEAVPWVGAISSSGLVARAAFGAETGVQVGSHYWLTSLRVSAIPPTEAAQHAALRVQLSAFSAALGGCVQTAFGTLRAAACGRIEAGVLRAHSEGARVDGAANAAWVALVPSLLFRMPIASPFAFRAEVGALLPLSAAQFQITGDGTLYSTARVAPELGLGFDIVL